MEQTLDLMILGARRYDMDGNKGASVYAFGPADEDDANIVGNDVYKLSAPYEVVELLRKYSEKLPATFTCKVLIKSSGGKATFKLKDLKATGQVQGKSA